jgi:hypothetical protein
LRQIKWANDLENGNVITNKVVRFLLGNSLASELYMPTFRNFLPVSFSGKGCFETSAYTIQKPGKVKVIPQQAELAQGGSGTVRLVAQCLNHYATLKLN